MDNKKILIGGLAIVGALALFMYLKPKPKKNSEGFFSAQGKKVKGIYSTCQGANGYYSTRGTGNCKGGDRGVTKYA
jgi:hypothetical protein